MTWDKVTWNSRKIKAIKAQVKKVFPTQAIFINCMSTAIIICMSKQKLEIFNNQPLKANELIKVHTSKHQK